MINFKARIKNPAFWISIVIAFFSPILAYMGITLESISSWQKLWQVVLEALKNPYVVALICVSIYNTIIDPTTKGFGDGKEKDSK